MHVGQLWEEEQHKPATESRVRLPPLRQYEPTHDVDAGAMAPDRALSLWGFSELQPNVESCLQSRCEQTNSADNSNNDILTLLFAVTTLLYQAGRTISRVTARTVTDHPVLLRLVSLPLDPPVPPHRPLPRFPGHLTPPHLVRCRFNGLRNSQHTRSSTEANTKPPAT